MRFVLGLGAVSCAVMVSLLFAASPVQAQEWCGFQIKSTISVIKCGYSSETKCRNAMGKDAVCILDPFYADVRRRWPRGRGPA